MLWTNTENESSSFLTSPFSVGVTAICSDGSRFCPFKPSLALQSINEFIRFKWYQTEQHHERFITKKEFWLSFASSSPTQNTTTLPWSKWHGSTETDQTEGKTLEKAEGLKPTSVHSHCFPVICLNFTFMLVLPCCQSFEWSHVHAYSIPRSVAAKYIPFSGFIYIKAPQIPDWTMIRQVWWLSAVISRGGKKIRREAAIPARLGAAGVDISPRN